jgi:hypothetical protein
MIWTENDIELFIKANKDKFNVYDPSIYHNDHFFLKLRARFRKFISIVPYLIKVFIVTVIVFTLSIWAWNSWIRKDRHEVTLKQKIENIIHIKK